MRVTYKSANGRIECTFDVEAGKAAFAALAAVAELCDLEKCGCCQSDNVVHELRHIETYDYYSFRCRDCGAQLRLGQNKDGKGLFIKRTDNDGNPLGENGWYIYQAGGQPMTVSNGQRGDAYEYGA